jgi:uncharacterized protein GlcG (DUF336 family)
MALKAGLALAIGMVAFTPIPGNAALPTQAVIPAQLAVKLAEAAVNACKSEGYGVTAVVVNTEGNVIVQIRGDGARIQTVQTAQDKAYSAVTLAANHNLDRTSGILGSMQAKGGVGIGSWPMPPGGNRGITLFPGGVNLYSNGQIVGALGVSGTPKGPMDEGCALKAREQLKSQF